MSVLHERELREKSTEEVARRMLAAARTAPKARGRDNLVIALAESDTRREIAGHMRLMVAEGRAAEFFLRDADNLEKADALVLIGTRFATMGLEPCGLCGFADCQEKSCHPDHPCAFNTGDLGIAVGSAVSVAMENRVDNRVMFSVGMAVRELNLLGPEVRIIHGIPLSVSGKNPFFDRKPKT